MTVTGQFPCMYACAQFGLKIRLCSITLGTWPAFRTPTHVRVCVCKCVFVVITHACYNAPYKQQLICRRRTPEV